jgi:type I restriction enzyme R subunit
MYRARRPRGPGTLRGVAPVNIAADRGDRRAFPHSTWHEIGGRAKAMVVTGSRLACRALQVGLRPLHQADQGYTGIKLAGGLLRSDRRPGRAGKSYTEVGMNGGIKESELPEKFERDDYQVLLVAEKYQTGFDQPLLHTMYVVKRLAGVQAVQTLSRLNRIAPGKSRTFVLDFANEEDDIFQAFKPYYETTPVGENADPQRLSELQHRLLEWAIFTPADVTAFAEIWYSQKREHSAGDHKKLNAGLDTVVQRFEEREGEEREGFRGQLTAYRNLYAFLSQIIPYQDSDLERLYAFVRNLLAKLPPPGDGRGFALDDEVALRFFRLQQMTEGSIDLAQGDTYPLKGPTDVGTGGVKDEAVALSSLIDLLNERFGTDFTEADQLFFDQIRASAEIDENIAEAARANNYANFSAYFDRMLDELFIARMEGNEEIFSRVMTDTAFRSAAHEHLAQEIFRRVREQA